MQQVLAWLSPLPGDAGVSGPNLEYDNAFLELTKAAEGKPESQFERAVPPDWRAVRSMVEDLFERTRDLRIAVLWWRAALSLEGLPALAAGTHLLASLLTDLWDALHPQPDEGDDDPYARANALAVLPRLDGGLTDVLNARIVTVKGVGELRVRDAEVALGQLQARDGEPSYTRDQLEKMLAAAEAGGTPVRADILEAQAQLKRLGGLLDQRFGSGSSADLKPLYDLVARLLSLTKEPEPEIAEDEGDAADGEGGGGARRARGSLSGAVTTRAEAIRAIDLICEYLDRAEPTNPAPLFLRRARSLIERNFLELLKELAPDALDGVARSFGVDPETIGQPPE